MSQSKIYQKMLAAAEARKLGDIERAKELEMEAAKVVDALEKRALSTLSSTGRFDVQASLKSSEAEVDALLDKVFADLEANTNASNAAKSDEVDALLDEIFKK